MAEKEDIITRTYDLLKTILPQLSKFPRDQKFILADRIENHLLDFLRMLVFMQTEMLGISLFNQTCHPEAIFSAEGSMPAERQ